VLFTRLSVKFLNEEVVKLVELEEGKDDSESHAQTLVETTDVADPVENAVHVAIDPVESEIELEGDLRVYVVREFVRSKLFKTVGENVNLVLRNLTELPVRVLQVQLCQLYLIDNFFAVLRVKWMPD